MSRLPSNRGGQNFVEYALMIILFAIVLLSILLILGDDLRTFINDLLQTWFPSTTQLPSLPTVLVSVGVRILG
jgi:Flp pilus assembly pilin Flp